LKTVLWLVVIVAAAVPALGQELSPERQQAIVENFMWATGQRAAPSQALSDALTAHTLPVKCGTPYLLDFYQNRDKIDRRLLMSLGVQQDIPRPQMQNEYGVAGGHTLIHYDKTGIHAVYQANVDSDGDGVPNYVETIAGAADSCYDFIFDSLGYVPPVADSACLDGGDSRVDIFLQALPIGFYGMTYGQWDCATSDTAQITPAWIVIDHDFQHLPDYVGRPLAAARVTLAHEIFHTGHFAIDGWEHPAWFEMTSVWMEEQKYDEINDYYLYDYVFYQNPASSLLDTAGNHHYQSVVFPIFLSEKFGRGIIHDIWTRAAALGKAWNWLIAVDQIVYTATQSPPYAKYRCNCWQPEYSACLDSNLIPQTFATLFTEFEVWNYFTGPYADQAPAGMRFSEAEFYDYIPMSKMAIERVYPVLVQADANPYAPQVNGATYLRLDNLDAIENDSLLSVWMTSADTAEITWGIAGIFQLKSDPDSHVVVIDTVGDGRRSRFINEVIGQWYCAAGQFMDTFPCLPTCTDSISFLDLRPYTTATIVFAPSTLNPWRYEPQETLALGYQVSNFSEIDPALVNLSAAVLTPYPNPAVMSEMDGEDLNFRFRVPTDTTSFPIYGTAYLLVDVFNVAGERVRTLEGNYAGESRDSIQVIYLDAGWDMNNQSGRAVASGVYLAVARLYVDANKQKLLAEDRVKVAVIR